MLIKLFFEAMKDSLSGHSKACPRFSVPSFTSTSFHLKPFVQNMTEPARKGTQATLIKTERERKERKKLVFLLFISYLRFWRSAGPLRRSLWPGSNSDLNVYWESLSYPDEAGAFISTLMLSFFWSDIPLAKHTGYRRQRGSHSLIFRI